MSEAYTRFPMSGVHVHEVAVGFGDCDPAGIVYFPRFFDYFHQAMESWFTSVGHPYRAVIVDRRIGFPAVHTEADFRAPTHFGETIAVELRITRRGRSSIDFGYRVRGTDMSTRVTGRTTCVVMDLDPTCDTFRRAIPIPGDLEAAITTFGLSESAE